MRNPLPCLRAVLLGAIALWILPPSLAADSFGVPISNFVISGTVTLPNGQTAAFRSREGTLITVRDENRKFWYAFVTQLDIERQQALFSPFTLTEENGKSKLAYVHQAGSAKAVHVPVTIGKRGDFHTDTGSFTFAVTAVESGDYPDTLDPDSASVAELQKAYGASSGEVCCLSKSAITICSSSLAAPFGVCTGGKRWLP